MEPEKMKTDVVETNGVSVDGSKKKLNTGIIAGVAVGLLLLGLGIAWLLRPATTDEVSEEPKSEGEIDAQRDIDETDVADVSDIARSDEQSDLIGNDKCRVGELEYTNPLYGYSFCYPEKYTVSELEVALCEEDFGPCYEVRRKGDAVIIRGFPGDYGLEIKMVPKGELVCEIDPALFWYASDRVELRNVYLWGDNYSVVGTLSEEDEPMFVRIVSLYRERDTEHGKQITYSNCTEIFGDNVLTIKSAYHPNAVLYMDSLEWEVAIGIVESISFN